MTDNLWKAKQVLEEKNLTLVLNDGKKIIESAERGVKPLLALLDSGEDFSSYSAADKVIGKGAAFLYVNLGIKDIYTKIISRDAFDVFSEHGFSVEADKTVPYIINRNKTGRCPMETAVAETDDPADAEIIIRKKAAELGAKVQG